MKTGMGTYKKKSELEYNSSNSNISESFDFNVEASARGLGEDFVFKFEDNKVTATNDVGLTGTEENDETASNASAKQQTVDDNNQQKNRNNNNDNSNADTTSETEAAADSSAASSSGSASSSASTSASSSASSAASSSTAGASISTAVGTVAVAATTAVVLVVGGSLAVYGQTIERPKIVEFEQLEADKNTIQFTLLVGNDYAAINSESTEQEECSISVELTCATYLDFKQSADFKSFGRLSSTFSDLIPETEYTLSVIQTSLMDLDNQFLMDPIKISTLPANNIIKPTSFAISPDPASVNLDETTQLSISGIQPENASTEVDWVSEDEGIAKIDETGTVTGISVGRTTVTATSKYDSSVKATATVSVMDYVPTFEKVLDPFGVRTVYMTCDVAHEDNSFEYVELTITRIDRETGEVDTTDEMYCTLRESPSVRQVVNFYPNNFDAQGLYKVLIEGFVPDETDPTGDGDNSSAPQSDGKLVTLYESQVDFAAISETIATQDFHTNALYLRKTQMVDGEGNVLSEYTSYEAYLDFADTTDISGVTRADGSGDQDGPYYIGFYETYASDFSYRSNDLIAQFVVELSKEVVPVDFNDSDIYIGQDYYNTYVVFTRDESTQDMVEKFRGNICLNDIAKVETKLLSAVNFDIEIDPFGLRTLYCKFDVYDSASYDEYQLTFSKLIRDTYEYDPESGTPMASVSAGDASERQPLQIIEEPIDYNGLYELTVTASSPDGEGGYTDITLLKQHVDFLTVETNTVTAETNGMYFQKNDYTDANAENVTALRRLDVYVGLEPDATTAEEFVIGVFTEEATSLEYNDQYMIASINVASVNQILEGVLVEERTSGAFDYDGTYTFILFGKFDQTVSISYEMVYRNDINLAASSHSSSGIVGSGEFALTKTLMGHYVATMELFSPDYSSLLESIDVAIYDAAEDELITNDISFEQVDSSHFTYYAEDSSDELVNALTSGNNKEIRISCQIEQEYVDIFIFVVEPDPEQDFAVFDCCANFEEGEEDPNSEQGERLVCLTVELNEAYFEKYNYFIVEGGIGYEQNTFDYTFSETIDDYGDVYDIQNQQRKLIELYDENSGSPISVFEGNLNYMYKKYTIYGITGEGQRVIIFTEEQMMV
ncbi:MAG: Ig-like domain-containing protein [Bacilli bacterium]|nr:Ig-like domain-containing protein [Bacilli bacterium]